MKKPYIGLIISLLFISCQQEKAVNSKYLFEKMPASVTGIDFKNSITEDVNHSIINYIYYYNGGGVAVGDVNNDSLPDLFFVSNMKRNKLYVNKGNLQFEDVTKKANIKSASSWNTGVSMVDINNDGFLDIYVCSVSGLLDFKGNNELFINNGDGTFTEKAKKYGLDFKGYSTQAYFFDYDKDDDLDAYIVNHAIHTTLSHGKADNRQKRKPLVGDVLLRNDNGRFIDVSEEAKIYGGANGYGLSASIADFNNDGWDDIYVCNDFHEDDYYYINNQDGTFSEKLAEAFTTISRFSMGSDVADINGDGYQDLITLDMLPKSEKVLKETEGDDAMFNMQVRLKKLGYKDQYSRNMLQINKQGSYFKETALFNRIADTDWSWAPLFADFNNDGHQDLFISNGILRRPNELDFRNYVSSAFKNRSQQEGLTWLYKSINEMPSGSVSNEIFKGNSKKFSNKTGDWIENKPSLSNGAVYVDLDLDGDLDLVTNNLNDTAAIYQNSINDSLNNYISVQFRYKKGNKEGIGVKTRVFANNQSQIKQLFKSRGFLSSLEAKLHFGLNTHKVVDSIQVIWPNNTLQTIVKPEINRHLIVTYSEEAKPYKYQKKAPFQSHFEETDIIDYVHTEDNYNDFVNEKLIPYKISTIGPAIAKADIDGNGYEDVFIGSASGQKSKILLNTGSSFQPLENKSIAEDGLYEDNDAVFFDADNDGDLDLYVASGMQEVNMFGFRKDRLYLNTNGKFKRSTIDNIPVDDVVTSCVINYDYDSDGDEDLFVGNYAKPFDFGAAVTSYVLVNDGKGIFTRDRNFKLNTKVTSAIWEDLNKDGLKDLIVVSEWDNPKLYINKKGVLKLLESPKQLNGLWQSVTVFDIDKDGDKDILLGNWGLNTKFNPNKNAPLLMYHSDFDANGKPESILAYSKNGNYYPVNSKDELAAQMNVISKRFVKHKDFSLKTMEELFTKTVIEKAKVYKVHTLASGYIENDNGAFNEFIVLPDDFQLAPITTFSKIEINKDSCLVVGGNSYRMNSYHGAFTSFKGIILNDIEHYKSVFKYGMKSFHQQIKAVESIKMKKDNLLLIVANNDTLVTYKYDK